MKQVFHVFKKDVRQHWMGISLVLILLGTYTALAPSAWEFRNATDAFLVTLLSPLVPIGWWLLIVRIVQGESLAGDRQFWVTRPYEWKQLLGAKILFIVLFINLPLLIAGMLLLARAGFSPLSYLPGLLWMQLLMGLIVLLPAVTVAAITTSVQQMAMVMLALLLAVIGLTYVSSRIPNTSIPAAETIPGLAQNMILLGTAIAVIVLQYARRKTTRSFRLLLLAAIAVSLIEVATPYATLIARAYPLVPSGQQPPVQFALHAPLPSIPTDPHAARSSVDLSIPLDVSGIARDTYILIEGVRVTLIARDGAEWKGNWEPKVSFLLPHTKDNTINFSVSRDFFEKTKTTPVTMRASFAMSVYHETDTMRLIASNREFAVPRIGVCSVRGSQLNTIRCRAPLRTPNLLVVRTVPGVTTCPVNTGQQPAPPTFPAYAWTWNHSSAPATFGISPVQTFFLWFFGAGENDEKKTFICPGTPLVFSTPEKVRQNRTAIEISGINLADYRLPDADQHESIGWDILWH